jgi:hypothetical protein
MILVGSQFVISSSLGLILHNASTILNAPISGCASRGHLVPVK